MKPLHLFLLLACSAAFVGCSAAPNGGYRRKPKVARPGGLTVNQTNKQINELNAHMGSR